MIGCSLSGAFLEIQSGARDFARSETLPIAAVYDRKGKAPTGVLAKAAGLLNVTIPAECVA